MTFAGTWWQGGLLSVLSVEACQAQSCATVDRQASTDMKEISSSVKH